MVFNFIIMNLINFLMIKIFKSRLSKIETFKNNPTNVQAKNFFYLLKKAKKTAFGSAYNFERIAREKDFNKAYQVFKEQVPLFNYDNFKDWITRTRKGEKNIIWPGKITMFSKSSGTTSDKSKFIPVTKNSLHNCHYAAGKDAFAAYFKNYSDSRLFTGKILSLGGSIRVDELNPRNVCGDVSAIIMSNLPSWIQLMRVPKRKIALMEEWENKLRLIIADTKNKDVVGLAGVPAWVLVLLRKMESETGRKITDIWPNLEMLVYGGVALGPYREQYKKICGEKMRYLETYGSAEGFFGVGDEKNRDDMLIMLDYEIFYEFIPLEELDKPNPKAYCIADVELNRNYAIVISTSGGLWRYIIGDTVKFTQLKPYRFIISGRTKSFINVFGEELMVDNANRALANACALTGAAVQEYSAAPVFTEENVKGCHEWLIEFTNEPSNLENFADVLDKELQKVNSDYEAKRYKDITLGRLRLVKARSNLFRDWLASKNKLGGQNKIPRLMNDRSIIEEMLIFNN
jgi:hypothetical protein